MRSLLLQRQKADFDLRVTPGTVRDQTYQRLKQAIISGHFAPGQRLVERDLCETVGVSRTSIREALRQLEADKLIFVEPHKGPCVTKLTAETAATIYEVRSVLESLAGQLAATRATDEEIAELDRSVKDFELAVAGGDLQQLVEIAARFYEILLTASRNPTIHEILNSLNARIAILRSTSMSDPGRSVVSASEMREIAQAIAARDPRRASTACATHVDRAAAAAKKLLAKEA
jgi:DNA-binding GntR family transcriptional regulator